MRNPRLWQHFEKIYFDITKTKYLQMGCWREGDELNVKNFVAAQERFADTLVGFIPEGVKSILDIGCGVGGNALKLKERGFQVQCISPSTHHEKLFKENTRGEIPFYLTTFEDFRSPQKFDLALMSESVQFIALEAGFKNCREVLRDQGYLLTADFYKKEDVPEMKRVPCYRLDDYLPSAAQFGFQLLKEKDITAEALPTAIWSWRLFDEYVKPFIDEMPLIVQARHPWVYRAVRLYLKRRSPQQIVGLGGRSIRPDVFAKYATYRIFLFQKRNVS
ncbi:MAG: class I SAM-dependent methyltransferase [Acidobacteria bacterium]|nr:class I SAM-dependent methyltransferase [Acidobacteriota bacterium]